MKVCLKFRKGYGSRGRARLEAKCHDCGVLKSSHYPAAKSAQFLPGRWEAREKAHEKAKEALRLLVAEQKLGETHGFRAGRRGRPGFDTPCTVCGVKWDKHPATAKTPAEHVGKLVSAFTSTAVEKVEKKKAPKAPKVEKAPKAQKGKKAPKAEKVEAPKSEAPIVATVETAVAEAFGVEFDPTLQHADKLGSLEALAAKCGDDSTSNDW